MKKWLSENWFDLVSVVSRVLVISGVALFVVSLLVFYLWNIETILGVKVAVILFFAGRMLGVLKGLR
ncbi:MAG: hypothetical protein RIT43_66 [Bacteroidota bacterium]|jgi:hypothetical protein